MDPERRRERNARQRHPVDHASGDLTDRARRALAALSPAHQQVMIEVVVRRRTVAEAADVLAIPAGTVLSRLRSALHAFRAGLTDAA
jgi:RNA polymerase sigma-70 factor (ECF subfamily)